jgi:hypothetical protein
VELWNQSSLELCGGASNVAGESRIEVCNEKQEHVQHGHSSVKEEYNSIYGGSNPWEVAKCQAFSGMTGVVIGSESRAVSRKKLWMLQFTQSQASDVTQSLRMLGWKQV